VRFDLPEGAEHDGTDDDGNDRFRVTIPLDEHGFFGRECPSCNRTFLVSKESYDLCPTTCGCGASTAVTTTNTVSS